MKTYTDDIKRDALDYVKKHPDLSYKAVAERLGIPKETLYGWIKKERRKSDPSFTGNSFSDPLTETEKENIRLKRELRDAEDVLEILKKPSAFWETDRKHIRCCS